VSRTGLLAPGSLPQCRTSPVFDGLISQRTVRARRLSTVFPLLHRLAKNVWSGGPSGPSLGFRGDNTLARRVSIGCGHLKKAFLDEQEIWSGGFFSLLTSLARAFDLYVMPGLNLALLLGEFDLANRLLPRCLSDLGWPRHHSGN